jgi:hypothetical protein
VARKSTTQLSRSDIIRSDNGSPSPDVGIDCKDSLQWECELRLLKSDVPGRPPLLPSSLAPLDEGSSVGTAESGGLFALRLNVNFVLGREAERVSSNVCSNKSMCCIRT